MEYEFEKEKSDHNLKERKISFAYAANVFAGPYVEW